LTTKTAARQTVKNLMGVLVFATVLVMLALLTRLVFEFFGELHRVALYKQVHSVTGHFLLPVHLPAFKTPYGGVFDSLAALSLVVVVGIEYVLSILRKNV
jgi:hypothetical protein